MLVRPVPPPLTIPSLAAPQLCSSPVRAAPAACASAAASAAGRPPLPSPRISCASAASLIMTGPYSPRGSMTAANRGGSLLMTGGSMRAGRGGGANGAAAEQAVCVVLHVRPMSAAERAKGCEPVLRAAPSGGEAVVESGNRTDAFAFDGVYGEDAGGAPPARLYADCVAPLVEGVFGGVSATVLAYGQTGAGKSYTMVRNCCWAMG